MTANKVQSALAGLTIYGDDFDSEEVLAWLNDEAETYANMVQAREHYRYQYHAINWLCGYQFMHGLCFGKAFGFGSAFADEFRPIAEKIEEIIVLESSPYFRRSDIRGTPINYIRSNGYKALPFKDSTFDLATCFGVLHHLPNVSCILQELYRCLRPGGKLLLREPTISMGDWRISRRGLSKRERGLPIDIMRNRILAQGFRIVRETRCMFSLSGKLIQSTGIDVFNNRRLTALDLWVCKMFSKNNTYHTDSVLKKLRPTSCFWLLERV